MNLRITISCSLAFLSTLILSMEDEDFSWVSQRIEVRRVYVGLPGQSSRDDLLFFSMACTILTFETHGV